MLGDGDGSRRRSGKHTNGDAPSIPDEKDAKGTSQAMPGDAQPQSQP
jgi:hypothetical protein